MEVYAFTFHQILHKIVCKRLFAECLADFQVTDHRCSAHGQQPRPFLTENKEDGQTQPALGKTHHLLFQTPRNGVPVDTFWGTALGSPAHPPAIFEKCTHCVRAASGQGVPPVSMSFPRWWRVASL